MNKKEIIFQSIGIIHSPHKKLSDIPIQPVFSNDIKGTVVVDPEFAEGLENQLISLAQSGNLRGPVTEEQLIDILKKLQTGKREKTIEFKRK